MLEKCHYIKVMRGEMNEPCRRTERNSDNEGRKEGEVMRRMRRKSE